MQVAGRVAARGHDALVERLRGAFAEAAAAHADIVVIDGTGSRRSSRAPSHADGLQWRRALAGVAADQLGIEPTEALSHPAVARAQQIVGAPSYEEASPSSISRTRRPRRPTAALGERRCLGWPTPCRQRPLMAQRGRRTLLAGGGGGWRSGRRRRRPNRARDGRGGAHPVGSEPDVHAGAEISGPARRLRGRARPRRSVEPARDDSDPPATTASRPAAERRDRRTHAEVRDDRTQSETEQRPGRRRGTRLRERTPRSHETELQTDAADHGRVRGRDRDPPPTAAADRGSGPGSDRPWPWPPRRRSSCASPRPTSAASRT